MDGTDPGVTDDTRQPLDKDEVPEDGEVLIERLEAFLDDLAEGHRARMEEVVTWFERHADLDEEIEASVDVLRPLFQRWSIEICFVLRMHEVLRFNELKRTLGNIGSRTLSRRLTELEEQGIVKREAYAEVPVRVEYSLTSKGMRLGDLMLPVIAHLRISRLKEKGEIPE